MNLNKLIDIANTKLLKVTNRPEIVIESGKGMYCRDTEGKKYLDFVAGWGVNALGHSPKAVIKALNRQAKTLVNASPAFYNVPMLEYAEALTGISCFERVFFCSIGAEANEGAVKLARKYGQVHKNGASDIITTWHSFHGRTLTMMSATGKEHWEKIFEPKTKGFLKADFNDIEGIKKLITKNTCAIMIEPIQGEGGVNAGKAEYIKELRRICDAENILLVFDEVQTGMCRTGKMFCYEHFGVEPDILTLAKGIGAGFPLAAMLTKERLNIFEPGEQGGTYTGQPLAMAVGLTVLREMINKDIAGNSGRMGKIIVSELEEMAKTYEIENIRGKGLMIGFDLKKTKGAVLADKCREDGLLINSPQEKSIRLMPALIINEKEIGEFFAVIKKHLQKN